MTLWIDDPDDRDPLANKFVLAVFDLVYRPSAGDPNCEAVIKSLNANPAKHYHSNARVIWTSFVKAEKDKVRALAEHLIQRFPADETIPPFLTAKRQPRSADDDWYVVPDAPEESGIVYGERRAAVVNRSDLRTGITELLHSAAPVLAIDGAAGHGKSHSCELIRHVVAYENLKRKKDKKPLYKVSVADVAERWPSRNTNAVYARMLAEALSDELKIDDDYSSVLDYTEPTRTARELATEFTERFDVLAKAKPAPRLLVIDGLDRPNVKNDAQDFAAHLALKAVKGELIDTGLVTTGFNGTFADDVTKKLERDRAGAISRSDIEFFFKETARHIKRELPGAELARLVEKALNRSDTDLRNLSEVEEIVLDLADEEFGP